MTMRETEQSIIQDFALLADRLNLMEYIVGCARENPGVPPDEKKDDFLVKDCEMHTWVVAYWEDGKLSFRADSESLLVKGALMLIIEIYNGRNQVELSNFSCSLLNHEGFSSLFNYKQKKGLQSILYRLKNEVEE